MTTPEDYQSMVGSTSKKNMGQFLHQFDPEIRKKHNLRNYKQKLSIKCVLSCSRKHAFIYLYRSMYLHIYIYIYIYIKKACFVKHDRTLYIY